MSNTCIRIDSCHVTNLFPMMSIGFMSHVDFKKRPCRPVEFKGQGPQNTLILFHYHCKPTYLLRSLCDIDTGEYPGALDGGS